jgi:hypothetical protein
MYSATTQNFKAECDGLVVKLRTATEPKHFFACTVQEAQELKGCLEALFVVMHDEGSEGAELCGKELS